MEPSDVNDRPQSVRGSPVDDIHSVRCANIVFGRQIGNSSASKRHHKSAVWVGATRIGPHLKASDPDLRTLAVSKVNGNTLIWCFVASRQNMYRSGDSIHHSVAALFHARNDELSDRPLISIIDDDDSVRSSLKSLVRSLGFGVCTFTSAEEFLNSPCQDDSSCLITDLQMPGMSGIELQQLLSAQGRHIPIIFVTAFPEDRIQRRALESGALGFLSKPFECQALVELIDKAIATGRTT
jgi:CheY-like chemotaxis protein